MADERTVNLIEKLLRASDSGDYGSFFQSLAAYQPTPAPKLRIPGLPKIGRRATPGQVNRILGHMQPTYRPGSVESVIYKNAARFGLDPDAVRAYMMEESGGRWNAVGDQGTSYGPFQMHRGGALGSHTAEWAMSPAGIIAGMQMMANTPIRGKHGADALQAIYQYFGKGSNNAAAFRRALPYLTQRPQQRQQQQQPPPAGGGVQVPTSFKATHDTAGISGYQPSEDIMSTPGTPVLAPENGRIVRYGSAQGGQALYFQGDSGRLYWIGHIENAGGLRRYRRGQRIAVVSSHHPRPHVHVGILRG